MLSYLVDLETDVVAFFYRKNSIQDGNILHKMEHIDDDLDERGIEFVKCSDKGIGKAYGIGIVIY